MDEIFDSMEGTLQKWLIGVNWKMRKSLGEAESYLRHVVEVLEVPSEGGVFVAVPFIYLPLANRLLQRSGILLAAQNMHWAESGAYTGEISAPMLKEIGVHLVVLGHSERREYNNEIDLEVNKKVRSALAHDLMPLVCVGEKSFEKEFGVAKETVAREVKIALSGVAAESAERVAIAYEPVWAIGEEGMPAHADYAAEIHSRIRETLAELFGPSLAGRIRIIYGGSVDLDNALEFMGRENVDGLFLGRVGLQPDSFVEVIHRISSMDRGRRGHALP